jgi:broad specificity phosphatase PhoE
MSVLWIRHGEKKFRNGKGSPGYYKHDPPLKHNCDPKINIVGHSIFLRYGVPDKIICSPFLRTRETAEKLKDFFMSNYNKSIEISIDVNIGEFLGWIKPPGLKAHVSDETLKYVKPILGVEKVKDVEERSKVHIQGIDKSNNVLIVTHGIVIEFIHKHLTGRKLSKVKELSGISLSGEKVEEFDIPV